MSGEKRDVFLLGAGFARAIFPTMPLLQDLADRIIDTPQGAPRFSPEVRSLMSENFAHAVSYLEQAKPWVTEADNLRDRALYLEISNAIAHVLDETVSAAHESLATSAPNWLNRLIRYWHEHRCTVLSLNYDTLIERAAAGVELADGERISPPHLYPAMLTDAALRSGGSAPERRRPTFRLLKLHGSTNWYYSGRPATAGEPIYFVPPLAGRRSTERERDQNAERIRAVADKYPFLIPPVYDKSPLLTHETIRALWFEAGDALKHARRIISMGYSLPPSDLTMMHFLRTTCAPHTRIEVVNEGKDALQNFSDLFRAADVPVNLAASGEDCIPAFIERPNAA